MNIDKSTNSFNVSIRNLDNLAWSELLTQFDDASIYQTWSYASVIYGKNNLSHVIVKEKEEVVAIAQVAIRRFPCLHTATANVHWGPLWRRKGHRQSIEYLKQILFFLKDEYVIRRKYLLRIWPNEIDNPDTTIRDILKNYGYSYNTDDRPYRTLELDIDAPLDELRKNLDQKWRNQLNRAEKNNLTIIEGNSDNLYQVFLKLQQEMLTRKNYSAGVNYQEYRLIQKELSEALKMKIIVCEHEGQPVSVAICSDIGDTGIYLLGATGDSGLKLNGSNLLQWQMIKWLRDQGCKRYDLGGIDPEGNPGVYRFKLGVVGKKGNDVTHIGQYIIHNSFRTRLLYLLIAKTKKIRKFISAN